MDYDEIRLSQSWIVECGFQQKRIAATLTVVAAGPFNTVNMHGQTEPATLARDVIEKIILQRLVT